MTWRARLGAAAAALGTAALLLATAAPATADDGTDIRSLDYTKRGLVLLVDVPPDATVDADAPGAVRASVAGVDYPTEAGDFSDVEDLVERTTILAIDTSRSMRGAKFEAAKQAARTFLDVVPADVRVGIVSFDSVVDPVLSPTTSRQDALEEIEALELGQGTRLYEAVIESVALAGTAGAGSVLLLSDGRDTSTMTPESVEAVVDASDVAVNAVALDQADRIRPILDQITGAAGEVIGADRDELDREYTEQARELARQVSVTIDVPRSALVDPVQVEIVLASSRGPLLDRSLYQLPRSQVPDESATPPSFDPGGGPVLPPWVMFAAAGLVAAAVLLAFLGFLPVAPATNTAEARIASYTADIRRGTAKDEPEAPILTQATEAIDEVLRRNQGVEERISARLTSAGSALKASEWLLLHAALAVGALLLGLLLGRGNPAVVLLLTALGVVVPWFWLGLRRGRRRQKFESALPETLQLMAGSLSAGLSMLQAIDTIVREGTDPVAAEFRRVLIEIRLGVPLDDALEGVADRFDSDDFRWVVMAIRIQRQVGGNLAELLTTVAGTIREREFIRRQVDALAAEGKLSAVVLGGLPPAFLLYLVLAQPSYVEPLFTDLRGLIMLVFSAVWLSIGIAWMSRLVKVEV
ncbi:type II secretion system F family protein [Nocardioides sp. 1609]|uniref:type II secretion system F family protein n=1 Tax=Nocardioides sp. 1609 TaxID=2508327 RepID=UPI00106F8CC2|nr:type II secretion system F family protein [Nocardioides sp. 1609]